MSEALTARPALEQEVEPHAEQHHEGEREGLAQRPAELRHVPDRLVSSSRKLPRAPLAPRLGTFASAADPASRGIGVPAARRPHLPADVTCQRAALRVSRGEAVDEDQETFRTLTTTPARLLVRVGMPR